MKQTLEELKKERDALHRRLASPEVFKDPRGAKEAGQRLAELETAIGAKEDIARLIRERADAEKVLAAAEDKELRRIAKEDIERISRAITEREKALSAGPPKKEERAGKIILEIRAGTGGEEAALFAAELLHMYSGYIKRMGWRTAILDSSRTSLGGIKEITLEVEGAGAYEKLKYESGVHRIQRIPETEKSGRIHTSTASVAVLPEAEEKDIEIKPQDIKFEFFRGSGPGGQNVNKVETGVRIIHLPTGVVVASQESRSQQQNRERALTLLRTKLLDEERQRENAKMAQERREQIGTAERVEKIRTYNFPQDRVTDHRIRKSFHNIASILEGNLDPIIDSFQESS